MSVQCVYAGRFGMWPREDATSWCNDGASDCLAFPVLFRKYQSPPTQFLHSPFDANVPPVACRIWGMLFEIVVPVHRQIYCTNLPAGATGVWMYYHWQGYAFNGGNQLPASHDVSLLSPSWNWEHCSLKRLFYSTSSKDIWFVNYPEKNKKQKGFVLCVIQILILKNRMKNEYVMTGIYLNTAWLNSNKRSTLAWLLKGLLFMSLED